MKEIPLMQASEPSETTDGFDDGTFERVADRERDHEPTVGLDDPRVPAVPDTTPRPGESDAQAAARLNRRGDRDAWGEPEDQPDHDGNEAYVQQDEDRP